MYNMIQKSDRDNHDYFVTLENSMNNMIPIGSRIFEIVETFAYKVTEHETFIGKIIKRK